MCLVTEIRIPSAEFKLGGVLGKNEGLRVEIERVIPAGERLARHLWVRGIDAENAPEVFACDADIEGVELVTRVGDSALLRVDWTADIAAFFDALVSVDGTCLRGIARDSAWQFTIRFGSREELARFYRECASRNVSVTVRSIHDPPSAGRHSSMESLSEQQYEALRTAFEAGYFAIPREITLQELAARLGISDTAASHRLRRGLQTVLGAEIAVPT